MNKIKRTNGKERRTGNGTNVRMTDGERQRKRGVGRIERRIAIRLVEVRVKDDILNMKFYKEKIFGFDKKKKLHLFT